MRKLLTILNPFYWLGLRAENDHLQKVLADYAEPDVRLWRYVPGHLELRLGTHPAVRLFVFQAAEMLREFDATNYVTFDMHSPDPEIGIVSVVIQKKAYGKKTPAERQAELDEELKLLRNQLKAQEPNGEA